MNDERYTDGLKTKTAWSAEGMRIKPGEKPGEWGKSWHGPCGLYSAEQVEPKRQPRPGKVHPLTPENIGAALFEINKAAKRRRDAGQVFYERCLHGLAVRSRRMKEYYYRLKDAVIATAAETGMTALVGWHVKQDRRMVIVDEGPDDGDRYDDYADSHDGYADLHDDEWYGDYDDEPLKRKEVVVTTYMACWALGGFRFHTIVDAIPDGVTEVANLGEWVSKATPTTLKMTLKDAKCTLDAYLESKGR